MFQWPWCSQEVGGRLCCRAEPGPLEILPRLLRIIPWSQRFSFILSWQILRREPLLLLYFFLLARSARAEKKKLLVKTVGILTFMPSAFDRRFWLENISNCSTSHMIAWSKYLSGCDWWKENDVFDSCSVSAEPAWKWDSQRSWPEASFSLGSPLRSALLVANCKIQKR